MSEQLNWEPIWDPTDPNKLGVDWQDYPSRRTPISAENLNQANDAIDILDDRIVTIGQQIDSMSTVGPALAAETTARQAADASLSSQIGTSISSHNQAASAHSDIRSAITSESTARASADAYLQQQIDNIGPGNFKVVRHTCADWETYGRSVSELNAIYLYTDYQHETDLGVTTIRPGAKIGDGTTPIIDLPFLADNDPRVAPHIANSIVHVTTADRLFWDEKWSGYITGVNSDILHFTKDREEFFNRLGI